MMYGKMEFTVKDITIRQEISSKNMSGGSFRFGRPDSGSIFD
jgi:hypothetical protein